MTFFFFSSLKHPAKYIGRKPRKYTVPVPIKTDVSNGSGAAGGTVEKKYFSEFLLQLSSLGIFILFYRIVELKYTVTY